MTSKQRQLAYMALGLANVVAVALVQQNLVTGTNMAICQAVSFGVAMLMKEWGASDPPPQLGEGK